MGDEHKRFVFPPHQIVKKRGNGGLTDRIECARRLVGNQNGRACGNSGGNRNTLPLAAGKLVRVRFEKMDGCGSRTRSKRSRARSWPCRQDRPRCRTAPSATCSAIVRTD